MPRDPEIEPHHTVKQHFQSSDHLVFRVRRRLIAKDHISIDYRFGIMLPRLN